MSRPKRWQAAIDKINEGLAELQDLKQEYEEWRDNLDGKFDGSPLVEKLNEIADSSFCDDIESAVGEAEAVDLPRGFGRD